MTTSTTSTVLRTLPERPNLEHLKNEAKQRLASLRQARPDAQLANAQFQLAREYGFSSWRELKAEVERRARSATLDPAGDWIGALGPRGRLALHVRRDAAGELQATYDARDIGRFGAPVDSIGLDGERLVFRLTAPSRAGEVEVYFEGRQQGGQWAGAYHAMGLAHPLTLSRGVFPPAPTIAGLDGIWDGVLPVKGGMRLTFRVRTGPQGTFAWCDSPDGMGLDLPVRDLDRDGPQVTFRMETISVTGEIDATGETIQAQFERGETRLPLVLARRPAGAPPMRSRTPEQIALPAEALDLYVGAFAFAGGWTAVVSRRGEALSIQSPGQPAFTLLPASRERFFSPVYDMSVAFDLDAEGRATALELDQLGRTARGVRTA